MEIKNDSKAKKIIVIVEKAQKCKVIHLEHTGVCVYNLNHNKRTVDVISDTIKTEIPR